MNRLLNKFPVLKNELSWFFLLIGASIFLRFFSFFPSELDHDESTYAIIGNEILQGKKLYTEVTDTKPVGIFLIYAGLQAIFGYSIFMKRLFTALLVAVTAYFVRKASFKMFSNWNAANASAIVYLFYTSMWAYFGLSPNTELYFNFFTILALLLFLKEGKVNYFMAGLFMGIGFIIKYLVLFDFVAFGLFFLGVDFFVKKNKFEFKVISKYILTGIGFLLPFSLTALYFYLNQRFNDFYFISFELPGLYKQTFSILNYLLLLADLLFRFFPITLFFTYIFFKERKLLSQKNKWFFMLWISMVLIAMYLPGKGFTHYSIQLMLPLSLLAGLFFHSTVRLNGVLKFLFRGKTGWIALSVVVLVIQTASYFENIVEPDSFKEVATYLNDNTTDKEQVFVSNYEPIIYYLMERNTPTKYVHANLLFTDLHKAFKFDNIAEIKRLMNHKPKFVLVQYENEIVEGMMGNEYYLDRTFRNDEILVYRLKTEN